MLSLEQVAELVNGRKLDTEDGTLTIQKDTRPGCSDPVLFVNGLPYRLPPTHVIEEPAA